MTRRQLIEGLSCIHDDAPVVACEANPTLDFDNSGCEIVRIAYQQPSSAGDLGIVFLLCNGLEQIMDAE